MRRRPVLRRCAGRRPPRHRPAGLRRGSSPTTPGGGRYLAAGLLALVLGRACVRRVGGGAVAALAASLAGLATFTYVTALPDVGLLPDASSWTAFRSPCSTRPRSGCARRSRPAPSTPGVHRGDRHRRVARRPPRPRADRPVPPRRAPGWSPLLVLWALPLTRPARTARAARSAGAAVPRRRRARPAARHRPTATTDDAPAGDRLGARGRRRCAGRSPSSHRCCCPATGPPRGSTSAAPNRPARLPADRRRHRAPPAARGTRRAADPRLANGPTSGSPGSTASTAGPGGSARRARAATGPPSRRCTAADGPLPPEERGARHHADAGRGRGARPRQHLRPDALPAGVGARADLADEMVWSTEGGFLATWSVADGEGVAGQPRVGVSEGATYAVDAERPRRRSTQLRAVEVDDGDTSSGGRRSPATTSRLGRGWPSDVYDGGRRDHRRRPGARAAGVVHRRWSVHLRPRRPAAPWRRRARAVRARGPGRVLRVLRHGDGGDAARGAGSRPGSRSGSCPGRSPARPTPTAGRPLTEYTVSTADAHAWVEVLFPGLRVDHLRTDAAQRPDPDRPDRGGPRPGREPARAPAARARRARHGRGADVPTPDTPDPVPAPDAGHRRANRRTDPGGADGRRRV